MAKMRTKLNKLSAKIPDVNLIKYIVELDGVEVFTGKTISGLGIETDVVEYIDGDNPITLKRPNRFVYNNITIHDIPISEEVPLYNWVEMMKNMGGGLSANKQMTIIMKDGNTEMKRWNLFNCFPVSYSFQKMESGKPLYADMVIAVEKFEIE